MRIKLSVDRIESGIAVCYDDECKKYEIPADGLAEGDIISAEFDSDKKPVSFEKLKKETSSRRREMASRTQKLFNRNKK